MAWTKTKNVWSPDPADANGEKNIQLTNMLGSTWGVNLPASSKEDAAVHKMLSDRLRGAIRRLGQSGFAVKGAFSFSGGYPANTFQSALSELLIDGLPIREVGTGLNSDASSQYTLPAPPGSGTRNDLVFLEMFLVEVPGSTSAAPVSTNKPDTSHVFKWGNVLYGGTNITDDINEASFEIRRRVQIQYRIRTVAGVNFGSHPNGIDDTSTVFAQGPQAAPTGLTYAISTNDAGLYIAGNGSVAHQSTLGTLDGYVYAVPIAEVARTTSTTIVSGNITDLRLTWGGLTYGVYLPLAGGNMSGGINESISTVASSATPDIWTGTGNIINFTGTTTVTGFAAAPQAGARRILVCASAVQFTNGATLLVPGGINYVASANDVVAVIALTPTVFLLLITKANGAPVMGIFGSNPALSGLVRLGNNGGMVSRNGANTADLELLRLDSSNVLNIGASGVVTRLGANGVLVSLTPALHFGFSASAVESNNPYLADFADNSGRSLGYRATSTTAAHVWFTTETTERMRLTSTGILCLGTNNIANANGGEMVLGPGLNLRGVYVGQTYPLIGTDTYGYVALAGGYSSNILPKIPGFAASFYQAPSIALNGVIGLDTTNNRLIYYVGTQRYYLSGTSF